MVEAAHRAGGRREFDVFEAMRKRRMHRRFTDEPVDPSLLESLVYAAGRAPLARPEIRHLVVVTDPRLMHTVRQMCPGFIANAPALIAVCTDVVKAEYWAGPSSDEVTRLDAGAAAGYLTLAAPALGLGVCIVTSWTDSAVQAILGLPKHIRPEVLVAVGHPVANPPKAMRRFPPHVHANRHGQDWSEEHA